MDEQKKERRNQKERRSGVDRRKLNTANYTGIEKRSNPDSRGGNDRRDGGDAWIEYLSPGLKK